MKAKTSLRLSSCFQSPCGPPARDSMHFTSQKRLLGDCVTTALILQSRGSMSARGRACLAEKRGDKSGREQTSEVGAVFDAHHVVVLPASVRSHCRIKNWRGIHLCFTEVPLEAGGVTQGCIAHLA